MISQLRRILKGGTLWRDLQPNERRLKLDERQWKLLKGREDTRLRKLLA